jgi:hypothetical protein
MRRRNRKCFDILLLVPSLEKTEKILICAVHREHRCTGQTSINKVCGGHQARVRCIDPQLRLSCSRKLEVGVRLHLLLVSD